MGAGLVTPLITGVRLVKRSQPFAFTAQLQSQAPERGCPLLVKQLGQGSSLILGVVTTLEGVVSSPILKNRLLMSFCVTHGK